HASTMTARARFAYPKLLGWAITSCHNYSDRGPLARSPTYWLPEPNPPRERWLTRSEAARLLWAARRSQHMRRFILLGLYTGSRPGVILAARWDQIDLAGKLMSRM